MSKTVTAKLNPTIVTKSKAKEVAAADGRKRPMLAINDEGKLVVCCRRTARKNGWVVQEPLYERAKTSKSAPEPVKASPTKKTPKKPAAKKAVKADVAELLGE